MSFKRFDPQDVVISAESISTPVWSGNVTTLDNFVTSSTQIGGPLESTITMYIKHLPQQSQLEFNFP